MKFWERQNKIAVFFLLLVLALGCFLLVAWASYSPWDSVWTTYNGTGTEIENKAGKIGAWSIDILSAFWGILSPLLAFVLIFVALYQLLSGKCDKLTPQHCSLFAFSFFLFLVGLSGCADFLLSDNRGYLGGGIIGNVFNRYLSVLFGHYLTLLFAVAFAFIGFYFCSGQTLLTLLQRLYYWAMQDDEENNEENEGGEAVLSDLEKAAQRADSLVNPPDFSQLNMGNEAQAVNSTEKNTMQFSDENTPNIFGLKNTDTDKLFDPKEALNKFQSKAKFDVENEASAVTISIPDERDDTSAQTVKLKTSFSSDDLPTVSFPDEFPQNASEPFAAQNSPQSTYTAAQAENFNFSADNTPNSASDNSVVLPKVEIVEPIPSFNESHVKIDSASETPSVSINNTHPSPSASSASSEPNAYPKNYGETLIHPALQRRNLGEKPKEPLPTLSLLKDPPPPAYTVTENEVREMANRINNTLANFKIAAKVADVVIGPVITRYEIQLSETENARKVMNIEDNLSRALMTKVRIIEFIEGKPYMGIEVPNAYRETVWLKDVFADNAFQHSKAMLPMALGKDISGNAVVVDMAAMPHLLVAGQTGAGKSVGLNSMLLSLMFKRTPKELRFLMIDPKRVELMAYNDIPHLLTPVITEPQEGENALRWMIEEMECRYKLMEEFNNLRDIKGFNMLIEEYEQLGNPIPNPLWRPGDTMDQLPPPLEKLPYIVVIIDEFGDFIMTAGKKAEDYIIRLGAKARSSGIHLILATQRPSTDVITGQIKAQMTSRIAFRVASPTDSGTILQTSGAERLLGKGDMLYKSPSEEGLKRIHGAFMPPEDVTAVVDNWRARAKPNYLSEITESREEDMESGDKEYDSSKLDSIFDEVVQYIAESGFRSTNDIQTRFGTGQPRAARIVYQLEQQGIISKPDARGKRHSLLRSM